MPLLDPPVLDLLAAAFPGAPIGDLAPTTGGFSHHSAYATIGGARCVVKAARVAHRRAALRREAHILQLLCGSGLPAPTLLALVEDDGWTVEAQGFVAGAQGLQMLAEAPENLEHVFAALGRLLAAVHSAPPVAPDPQLLCDRASVALVEMPNLALDADVRDELAASLAHPAWRPAAPRLIHGDAGLHNLLWDGRITALLDWEWAGWGEPLLDLAWVYWTMRWRDLPGRLWRTFLGAYGRGPAVLAGDMPGALRALAIGQVAGILARSQGEPAAWTEWLRRLRWTLALTFPKTVAERVHPLGG
jgi:aminoglycoside phosphotransferase (APT) family kinase protein